MRRPRTGLLLLAVVSATIAVATPALAATGTPSSGPDAVVAESRTSLERAAEAYALDAYNDQRRSGRTRNGVTYGDVARTSSLRGWTDLMTVSRRWADRMGLGSEMRHNASYTSQIGHWSAAAENIAARTIKPTAKGSPTTAQVIAATERVMQSWWTSAGHRDNWMDPRWDHMSVGVAIDRQTVSGRSYWVLSATANFRRVSGSVPSPWRSFALDGSRPPNERSSSSRYADVPPWHTFHGDIDALAKAGITSGCGGDRYCPDDVVTRGQMAAFLDRALDLRAGSVTFADSRGHLFAESISALARAGITQGCNPPRNTRYCPDARVTRGQMAAFLDRALDLRSSSMTFRDSRGHMFEDSIASLARAGITQGCNPPTNSRFCPNEPVTRGQMAAFMVRAGLAD